MASSVNNRSRAKKKLSFQWGAIVYLVLFIYSIIMTQLLRNAISAVFFWFMLIAGPISFIIMLLGKALIQVYVHAEVNNTVKLTPVEYEIRIINQSPLIYPFVEAYVAQPTKTGIRSENKRMVLTLTPFGGYIVKTKIPFKYRGFYEIGVSELYVSDPLRLFKLRIDIDNYSNVTVVPRNLEIIGTGRNSVSDIPTAITRHIDNSDFSDVSNIREYRLGDSLKTVHWKLSTKAEELQVKEFNTNDDSHTYVFVDVAAPMPAPQLEMTKIKKKLSQLLKEQKEDKRKEEKQLLEKQKMSKEEEMKRELDKFINETSARGKKSSDKKKIKLHNKEIIDKANEEQRDEMIEKLQQMLGVEDEVNTQKKIDEAVARWGGAVCEDFIDEMPEYTVDTIMDIAVSVISKEIKENRNCTICTFDKNDILVSDVKDVSDFNGIYAKLATLPVIEYGKNVADLTSAISESVNITIKIITSNLDPVSLGKYLGVPAMFGGAGIGCSVEVLMFNPVDKYTDKVNRMEYISSAAVRLKQNGIDLIDVHELYDGESIMFEGTKVV